MVGGDSRRSDRPCSLGWDLKVTAAGPLPLEGWRVVVTRSQVQADALSAALAELGAVPLEVPVIAVVDPADGGGALRAAAAGIERYACVVVTSTNGAERLLAARAALGLTGLGTARVAAVGSSTAEVLASAGVPPDVVPDRFVAEALLEALPDPPVDGARLLLARAETGRHVLPDGLAERGWQVDVVDAYRTVAAELTNEHRELVAGAHAVTFTSSSTVDRLVEAVGVDGVPPVVACIGPITAATARARGLHVDVEAPVHTIVGLAEAFAAWGRVQPRPRQ